MGFYYFSIFSLVPLAIAYGALGVLFWGIARGMRSVRRRGAILGAIAIVFLILPVGEELWIAWNFDQACKQAGTFVYKKVQVEGFYDDTTHWWRQLKESSTYKFVESRDTSTGALWRVERDGDDVRHFRIERPTARYHFKNIDPIGGTPWAHKVVRSGSSLVFDVQSEEEVARYVSFARRPPWYFMGLDTPGFGCDAPKRWPYTRGSGLIYRDALIAGTENR